MIHIHLESCASTQTYLQELFTSGEYSIQQDMLVSTNLQTHGQGRRSKKWMTSNQALAFSFTTWPSDRFSLSSLEMAIHVQRFIKKEFAVNTYFKWPNDVYIQAKGTYKKCAGILIQGQANRIIVGIGINIHHAKDFEFGAVSESAVEEFNPEDNAHYFYKNTVSNRIPAHVITQLWSQSCLHINKKVSILDGENIHHGTFLGVGEYGQCQLLTKGKKLEFFSASLILDQE